MEDTFVGQRMNLGDVCFRQGEPIGVWGAHGGTFMGYSDNRIIRAPSKEHALRILGLPSEVETLNPFEDAAMGNGLADYMEKL